MRSHSPFHHACGRCHPFWWVAEPDPAVPEVEEESCAVCIALACRYERVIYTREVGTQAVQGEKVRQSYETN